MVAGIVENEPKEQSLSDKLEPAKALGIEFIRQFKGAVFTKNNTFIGDYSLPKLLRELHEARDGKTTCSEEKLREVYPEWAALPVSIVDFKTDILKSLIRESLANVSRAPFVVDPTPKSEIPSTVKQRILEDVASDLEGMFSGAEDLQIEDIDKDYLLKRLKKEKVQALVAMKEHSSEEAQKLQVELYDKTTEGGYRTAILEFADDFALYPLAILHGPFPTVIRDTEWKGDKFVDVNKTRWSFERVSPFDFFWTEDSKDSQSGTAVFIRKKVPYDFLYNARELARDESDNSGYIEDSLSELIEQCKDSYIPQKWVDFYTKNPETHDSIMVTPWRSGDSIEILIRYGRFLGSDLLEMGYKELNEDRSYETKVVMVGGKVIQCQLNKNPGENRRPINTASFSKRNGSMVGISAGYRLLGLHKAFRAVIQLAMYNLGLASEPITEAEFARISRYVPANWDDNPTISPGMVILSDGAKIGDNKPAVKFTQIPTTTRQSLRMAEYIFDMSHVISNIPAALHGQPVGSGANRTIRGLLTLQGNTLKPIHSGMENIDMGVIEPMVQLMYRLLVMYDEDFDYTGDAKIVAKGASTMIEKQLDKQTAIENLQVIGQFGDTIDPQVKLRAVLKLFRLAGILEPGEDLLPPQEPQEQMVNPANVGIEGATPTNSSIANPADIDTSSIPGSGPDPVL